MKTILCLAVVLLVCTAGSAQIVQFSGASTSSSQQFLVQQFSGPPIEIWGTQRENSSYAGASLRVQRNDNNVQSDIPFTDGKNASVSAFNTACSGTTCLLTTYYGQMGVADCVQATKANMPSVSVDTDSKLTVQFAASKWCASASTAFKTATAHVFGVFYPGYVQNTTGGPQYNLWTYDGGSGSRYGLGLWPYNATEALMFRNNSTAGNLDSQGVYGNAHLGGTSGYHIWDLLQNTGTLRHDAVALTAGVSTAAITYPATNSIYLGNNAANDAYKGKARLFVLYDSARADRDSISTFLMSEFSVTALPGSASTADGFTWTPQYFPSYTAGAADIFNIAWWEEQGGYAWSMYYANNLASPSTTTLERFEVRPGDDATLPGIDGTERSENGGLFNNTRITAGTDFEIFAQFKIEAGSSQTGEWADIFQTHYGQGEISGSPDLVYISVLNNNFVVISGGNGSQTNRSSAIPFSRDTWYALRISGHASANHTSDTLQVWLGANGGTLTQVTNVASSAIFNSNSWDGYLKRGIYRGFPNSNAGTLAMYVANYQFSATLGAYSSFVTTQPALPTHNFLLKRDLDPAANDNTPMWLEQVA